MRSPAIALVFALAACGGSSLKVGSDDSGGGGSDSGGSSSDGGRPTGGTDSGGGDFSGGGSSDAARGGSGGNGSSTGATGGAMVPRGGVGGTTGTAGERPTGGTSSITSCTDEFPFAGEWEGNVLDYFFEPIDQLRLSVSDVDGTGLYVGSITWGYGDMPPPATDPDAPYPPGLPTGGYAGAAGAPTEPWPGFPYTIGRGAGCDSALRVSVLTAELWDGWCALQTPVYTEGYGWGCTYQGGGSFTPDVCMISDNSGNPLAEYPVWKCALCGNFGTGPSVCQCSESICWASREATHNFDLTLTESGGVDVLTGPDVNCGDCTVRLERAP